MKIIGIVAEYNPFHIGHTHQLNILAERYPDALIIVAMSGSFVQRGEPAIFDKFSRARSALLNGAHAVIELPAVYATANAERFASGAVRLLAKLGATMLAFGSENDDAQVLWQMASLSRSDEVQTACRNYLQQGRSYGTALRQALTDFIPHAAHNGPNTLLGLEYVKAIQNYDLPMEILPIKRTSAHHASALDVTAPSGSALRRAITDLVQSVDFLQSSALLHSSNAVHLADLMQSSASLQSSDAVQVSDLAQSSDLSQPPAGSDSWTKILQSFPPSIHDDIQTLVINCRLTDYAAYEELIHFESRRQNPDELLEYPDFSEGLHTLWTKAGTATSWSEAIEEIKSKRYTYARLQRMGAYTVLNLTKELQDEAHEKGPLYGRLLGFTDKARPWLKSQSTVFPIIQKWGPFLQSAAGLVENMALLDTRSTNIRALCVKNKGFRKGNEDYIQSPLYIKNA